MDILTVLGWWSRLVDRAGDPMDLLWFLNINNR